MTDVLEKPKIERLTQKPEVIEAPDWEMLQANSVLIWPVGSRTIEGAHKPDSDYDFLVLSAGPIPDVYEKLGFQLESGDKHYEPSSGAFNSWRKGSVNLVATYSPSFSEKFLKANTLAKSLRLTNRGDRVTLFKALLYQDYAVEIPNADIRWA